MESGSSPPDVSLETVASDHAIPPTETSSCNVKPEQVQLDREWSAARKVAIALVDRYYCQLRHGCNKPTCRTPTCHTFRSARNSGQPYRKPTKLTARAMAACLAGSDAPRSWLCPGGVQLGDDPLDRAFPLLEEDWLDPPHTTKTETESTSVDQTHSQSRGRADRRAVLDRASSPGIIDAKSAVQMLFNTAVWQSAERTGRSEPSLRFAPLAKTELLDILSRTSFSIRVLHGCYDSHDLADVQRDTNMTLLRLSIACKILHTALAGFTMFDDFGGIHLTVAEDFEIWIRVRQQGRYFGPYLQQRFGLHQSFASSTQNSLVSMMQDSRLLRLTRMIILVVASRTHGKQPAQQQRFRRSFAEMLVNECQFVDGVQFGALFLEWCRYILQLEWDGKPTFSWSSMTGAVINVLSVLYTYKEQLKIPAETFPTHFLFSKTAFTDVARSWLAYEVPHNHEHLLSFPWLFPESSLISYFRSMNHSKMATAVNSSLGLHTIMTRHNPLVRNHEGLIWDRLRVAISQFLVVEIRRDSILEDALSELWRREKQELRRPLKVRMGMEEGEEGVDLGGVQQEFFRLAFAEALSPDYGLFKVDERTRMAYFMPSSTAPSHEFELLGLLMGLAVYNGVTLSVTFPLALYNKLLGKPVTGLEHIIDGWPDLARGLQMLLDYEGDDVEDVFARSYVFSSESNGEPLEVSVSNGPRPSWPQNRYAPSDPPDALEEAPMVSHVNKHQYVKDYIQWLAHNSVQTEFEYFAKGFFYAVDRHSLAIFNPQSLRNLVEGYQSVDVEALQRVALYENGYSADHEVMQNFWKVVKKFSTEEALKLLEFVTASDRIPARGIEGVTFILQKNGEDDERLPTSMTCFGRLLLPAYSSEEVMEVKLRQAVENSLGFGVA